VSIAILFFYLFIICFAIQVLYWLILFSRVSFAKVQPTTPTSIPISVIICGHNEAENFRNFLPQILKQHYPHFEVIVVNDRSTDDSSKILASFEKEYNQLRVINLTDFERKPKGKKFALKQGLTAAKHDIVLLTDADCYPRSDQWIATMASGLNQHKTMGIAYAPLDKRPTFLNRFLRYDKIYIAIQYLSFALVGMPYMGAGANLIYRKELFFKSNGFQTHTHLASGDDDLFVNEVASKKNLAVVLQPNSFVYCEPKETLQQFYHQKSRHISTSWHYKLHHKILLGLLASSHFLFYVFGVFAFFATNYQLVTVSLIILRWAIMLFVFRKIADRLDEKDITAWLPLMDILYVLYYFIFALPLLKGNNGRWE